MKTIIYVLVTLLCRQGTLTSFENHKQYKLECVDTDNIECVYELEIPSGLYQYVSSDMKDTTVMIVGPNKDDVHIYRSTGNFRVL